MRLSPILSVYIGRTFLASFLGVLAFIIGLILLGDTLELMRRLSSRENATLGAVLTMALLKLPQMLHLVMPFAVMLGSMIALWRLSRSHELVAVRSAGVSVWQILAPVLGAAFLLGVIGVTVLNPLAAALHSRFEAMEDRFAIRDHGLLSLGEGGLWLRELQPDGESVMVVHAERVRQEGSELKLHDLSILYVGADKRFTHRIEAKGATLLDGTLRLHEAWDMRPGKPSRPVPTMEIATNLTPQRINDNFASPESISFWELPGYIEYFEASGFSAHRQRLHLQGLLSSPLLLCAMVLVAAAFALQPNLRSGGMLMRFGSGVLAALLFYFFSNVVQALGASQTLPLVLAAWAPPVVTALAGLALLFHFEDG